MCISIHKTVFVYQTYNLEQNSECFYITLAPVSSSKKDQNFPSISHRYCLLCSFLFFSGTTDPIFKKMLQ